MLLQYKSLVEKHALTSINTFPLAPSPCLSCSPPPLVVDEIQPTVPLSLLTKKNIETGEDQSQDVIITPFDLQLVERLSRVLGLVCSTPSLQTNTPYIRTGKLVTTKLFQGSTVPGFHLA